MLWGKEMRLTSHVYPLLKYKRIGLQNKIFRLQSHKLAGVYQKVGKSGKVKYLKCRHFIPTIPYLKYLLSTSDRAEYFSLETNQASLSIVSSLACCHTVRSRIIQSTTLPTCLESLLLFYDYYT